MVVTAVAPDGRDMALSLDKVNAADNSWVDDVVKDVDSLVLVVCWAMVAAEAADGGSRDSRTELGFVSGEILAAAVAVVAAAAVVEVSVVPLPGRARHYRTCSERTGDP